MKLTFTISYHSFLSVVFYIQLIALSFLFLIPYERTVQITISLEFHKKRKMNRMGFLCCLSESWISFTLITVKKNM